MTITTFEEMKIYLSDTLPNKAIVYYTLQQIAFNKGFTWNYVKASCDTDISVGCNDSSEIQVSDRFFRLLSQKSTSHHHILDSQTGRVMLPDGQTDLLSSIFYFLNVVQEWYSPYKDNLERFAPEYGYHNSVADITDNLVQKLIDEFCEKHVKLEKTTFTSRKSGFFLTHDIDNLYKSKNEDGKYALTHGLWHHIPRLLWNHYIGTPDLFNLKEIAQIENRYGFSSTFFWLVVQNKNNADYNFHHKKVQEIFDWLSANGFTHGLHKAWHHSSFDEELKKLGVPSNINRYHFLKFNVEQLHEAEISGIEIDCSLGFSQRFGFRNNYGLPFHPF
ncbi:MAG: hypothetical protein NZ522_04810, partial [Chitinophagales bacterium]|nr:hypothetical protein [Chitinophagales bacterium]